MRDVLTMLPIFIFMLIPLWIPLIAMAIGGLHDLVTATTRRAAAPAKTAPAKATVAGRRISSAGPQGSAAGTAA